MIEFWKTHPAKFTLSQNQWNDLNRHFEKLLHEASVFERWEAMSIVKRMALVLFRIAMLLTAIRRFEFNDWTEELVCRKVCVVIRRQVNPRPFWNWPLGLTLL